MSSKLKRRGPNFELISRSTVSALLEISCSLPYSSGIRQQTARCLARLTDMRPINGTTMAQTGG
jgi:hypothetical protein